MADDPELIAQFERHGVEAMRHLVAGDRFPNQIMPIAAKWLGEQERQANLVAAQQRSAEWAEQQRIAAKTLWVPWLGAGAGIVAAISGIVAAVASVWALLPRK